MSEDELQENQPPSKDLSEEISKQFYDPLDHIKPKQQKFAMMQVTTTMSPSEIAKVLGISDYKRRKWQKDEHVNAYLKQCQKKYADDEMVETAKRQTIFIREEMFKELLSRFVEDPDEALDQYKDKIENKHGREITAQEIIDFKNRFAKNTSFKDFMKIWEKVEKSFRLDSDQATTRVDEKSLEVKAKKRFTKHKSKKEKVKKLDEKAQDAVKKGMSWEEFQQEVHDAEFEKVSDHDENGEDEEQEVVEAQLEEDDQDVEEVILEEWEIKRG